MGITQFKGIFGMPPSVEPIFMKFDWNGIFSADMLIIVFTLLFVDLFDCIGTVIGVANRAGMMKDGKIPRLKQVFINIVDNAMKFTVGRPKAEIKISSQVLDDQIVMIIEDNGSGISPEDLKRVKEKFYKGSSNKSGTGLGLSIASEIMELHGGKMLIDSTQGKGTKVVLVMPYYYDYQQQ